MDDFENLDTYIKSNNNNKDSNEEEEEDINNINDDKPQGQQQINKSSSSNKEEEDEEEYLRRKNEEIEQIQPHYSSEEEILKFQLEDLKNFIEKLEQSNEQLALAYQDDPDPIYYESIKENIATLEKKKKLMSDIQSLIIQKEGIFIEYSSGSKDAFYSTLRLPNYDHLHQLDQQQQQQLHLQPIEERKLKIPTKYKKLEYKPMGIGIVLELIKDKNRLFDIESIDLWADNEHENLPCLGYFQSIRNLMIYADHKIRLENSIPKSVVHLSFGSGFNQEIKPGDLPVDGSLESISFSFSFNQPITRGSIPDGVKTLVFANQFNQPIGPGVLPDSLRKLEFGDNKVIRYYLCGLAQRYNRYEFNQPFEMGSLPPKLKTLVLSQYFNNPLPKGTLPSSLKCIEFGKGFNCQLNPGDLPEGLERLIFTVDSGFVQDLVPGVLPSTLTYFDMGGINVKIQPGSIPRSVRTLVYSLQMDLTQNEIPYGIKELIFSDLTFIHIPVGKIPNSVEVLDLQCAPNPIIEPGLIPSSVRVLRLSVGENTEIKPGGIPSSVENLYLFKRFGAVLPVDQPGIIPEGVKQLYFCDSFTQQIQPGFLPSTIRLLSLGNGFNQPFLKDSIPSGIETIILSESYTQPIDKDIIPDSVVISYSNSKHLDW
eukprot:gene11103-13584_t